jgi:hypothetical protein
MGEVLETLHLKTIMLRNVHKENLGPLKIGTGGSELVKAGMNLRVPQNAEIFLTS